MDEIEPEPAYNSPTFDEWLFGVFGPSRGETARVYDFDISEWDESAYPLTTLQFLTDLFNKPGILLERYTHRQIDSGLYYLVSPSYSEHMRPLLDETIPWSIRQECILSMLPLYQNLMQPLYKDLTAYKLALKPDPLHPNSACYMWWDVIVIWGESPVSNIQDLIDSVFVVFEGGLKLESEACLESILHGLGQWYYEVPDRVVSVVEQFLKRDDLSTEIREYARMAMNGRIV